MLLAIQDANRQGWLTIGFGAGAPRLEGRRRDQERELKGGRGRFGSGRHRCSPEVSTDCDSVLDSWIPSARPAEPAWEGRRRQAPHHVSQGRAGQGYPERLQTVSAREQGRGWEDLGGGPSSEEPGFGRGSRWAPGKRGQERNGVPGPQEGPQTEGRHRGTLREEGDVDGASGEGGGGPPEPGSDRCPHRKPVS